MPAYCVLIVDDQRDIRRLLRAGIETLQADIKVIDVPSGEEAILVISRQPIDLMVSDIRLPGISGLELQERAHIRNPAMRFILVTGMVDEKVRRQVAKAGADAFFFKPLDMSDFLDAVQECLGLKKPAPPQIAEVDELETAAASSHNVSEPLSRLRQETGAICTVLIEERGQVVAQAGNLPDEMDDPTLIASLMGTFSAASKVAHLLGTELPRDMLFFAGEAYHLSLSHVGLSLGLLVVLKAAGWEDEQTGKLLRLVAGTVQDLLAILAEMGVLLQEQTVQEVVPEEAALQPETAEETPLPELEAIFSQARQGSFKAEEVDAFWDSAVVEDMDGLVRADVISYDQARQLGLTPEET
jgi:DNA-binding response OmpR family regulator